MRVVSSFLDLAQVRTFLGTVIDVIRNLKCLRYFHNKTFFFSLASKYEGV